MELSEILSERLRDGATSALEPQAYERLREKLNHGGTTYKPTAWGYIPVDDYKLVEEFNASKELNIPTDVDLPHEVYLDNELYVLTTWGYMPEKERVEKRVSRIVELKTFGRAPPSVTTQDLRCEKALEAQSRGV